MLHALKRYPVFVYIEAAWKISLASNASSSSARRRYTSSGSKAVDQVELAGWIATGGEIFSALTEPAVFARAKIADYGSSVAWDDDDLRIDAAHLDLLAREQRCLGTNKDS
jgi:hypothetical protein